MSDVENKFKLLLKRLYTLEEFKEYNEIFLLETNKYMLVDFVNQKEKDRIKKLVDKNIFPFLGLFKTEIDETKSAWVVNNSRNFFISYCSVNGFSITLGKDSTIIIDNHKQSINVKDIGILSYSLKLCILISFGEIINKENYLDYLEDLISYFLKMKQGVKL